MVLIDRVRKAYGSGAARQLVLDHLSLKMEAGEFAVVLGPSGCGKTTLLNLIGGLDTPDAGRVRACGLDLTNASRVELTAYRARSVGFVFQFYNLLPTLTAQENVEAGVRVAGVDREPAREASRSLLARVGLGSLGDRFPSQLSGGEQQRVAIARALAKQPRLLLADEPTGNLDEETAGGVLDLMRELNEETGTTFVVVSHNPVLARAGKRVVRLSHGGLAEPSPV
ncbi:MAG: ABC transporter ATP-binding protein [Solirubrobacterales bacterium]|nr:ABC transporter ATP-binding protein [Solirubrobacterales bacterium]